MDNTEKVVRFVKRVRIYEKLLNPPNINLSDYTFIVTENNEIIYGLGAIKELVMRS